MNKRKMRMAALLLATGISGAAQAALHDRGGGLIYDDVLDVTWLQDANYAKTSGYDDDGMMTWDAAVTWVANLSYYDSVHGVAYTDWRLPTVEPLNGSTFTGSDFGESISASGTLYAGSTASEMAYLYQWGMCGGWCASDSNYITNVGTFTNADPYTVGSVLTYDYLTFDYWSGTESAPGTELEPGVAWAFDFYRGYQGVMAENWNSGLAWAVRDGDVAAVPEPEAYAMFLAGLGLVSFMARRRKKAEIRVL